MPLSLHTRLVLSLMILLGGPAVCYLLARMMVHSSAGWRLDHATGRMVVLMVPLATLAWILVWGRGARWTPQRLRGMAAASAATGLVALLSAMIFLGFDPYNHEGDAVVGGLIWMLLWCPLTALILKSSPAEQRQRIAARGPDAIRCPTCGYSMNGLREVRCPECGGQWTLDEFIAAVLNER